jgi:glycerol-3-phosphate responsive antiterminator
METHFSYFRIEGATVRLGRVREIQGVGVPECIIQFLHQSTAADGFIGWHSTFDVFGQGIAEIVRIPGINFLP